MATRTKRVAVTGDNGCENFSTRASKYVGDYDCVGGVWGLKKGSRGSCNPKLAKAKLPEYECYPPTGLYRLKKGQKTPATLVAALAAKKARGPAEKRPLSAFFRFMADNKDAILAGTPAGPDGKKSVPERGRTAGNMWKALTEAEREQYKAAAKADPLAVAKKATVAAKPAKINPKTGVEYVQSPALAAYAEKVKAWKAKNLVPGQKMTKTEIAGMHAELKAEKAAPRAPRAPRARVVPRAPKAQQSQEPEFTVGDGIFD